jgi:2-C-methyl-D-erythritol 4-phosphate cytidylyltransferase
MTSSRVWAVVPAAGIGARVGAALPKQYLPLLGRPMIAHALVRVAGEGRVVAVAVALAEDDRWWPEVPLAGVAPVRRAPGGPERCHSVLNALDALAGEAGPEDWVLVHDAARPCVRREDVDRLLAAVSDHPVGGLLGLPVRDTMKRADGSGVVRETVSREGLWHALTPQVFRFGRLREALRQVVAAGGVVTDEAQALELAGHAPRILEGSPDNIKVTRPEDLALAELYLRAQGTGG